MVFAGIKNLIKWKNPILLLVFMKKITLIFLLCLIVGGAFAADRAYVTIYDGDVTQEKSEFLYNQNPLEFMVYRATIVNPVTVNPTAEVEFRNIKTNEVFQIPLFETISCGLDSSTGNVLCGSGPLSVDQFAFPAGPSLYSVAITYNDGGNLIKESATFLIINQTEPIQVPEMPIFAVLAVLIGVLILTKRAN